MALLELTAVSKQIGERTLIHRVDMQVVGGEIVALTGANGSGKTTLLRLMAGLGRPTEGSVRLFGAEPGSKTRKRTGVLLDESFLYGELTAEENLLYYARLFRLVDPRVVVSTWLRRVELQREARQPVRSFSKGMRQRLGIARMALHNPDLMLLDEPFDGLDWYHALRLEQWLGQWREQGKGIVLVSHDADVVRRLATRVVRLTGGFLRTQEA